MSRKRAECPSCGAPVVFNIDSSLVVVCESCHSLVARTDQKLEDLGKVSAIADSDSPLTVGLSGKYNGKSLEFTGRAQLRHQLGGVWDEWYLILSNGRWGWLAEAQGRFFLTLERPLPTQVPPFDELSIGNQVLRMRSIPAWSSTKTFDEQSDANISSLVVAEKGIAEYIAAEGEIPFRLEPGKQYPYADLSGSGGEFGTLDYSQSPPRLYLGKEVTLQELGLPESMLKKGGGKERRVNATKIACPHCGGALELKAPDKTERVICPYCNSMLDANNGQLNYLKTLDAFKTPLIPLGKSGEFEGRILTVIGYMKRSTILEGERWTWDEYLLYHPALGYRWLVFSDDEWSYVKPVPVGEVKPAGNYAKYNGRSFYRIQASVGKVEHVVGEFYWKVEIGESVEMEDFQSGSEMLSKESYGYADGGGEVSWSFGTKTSHATICSKFGLPYSALSAGSGEMPGWLRTVLIVAILCLIIWFVIEISSQSGGAYGAGYRSGSSGGHSGFGGFGGGK